MVIHGITPGITSNTGGNIQVLVIYFLFYNIMLSKLSSYHWLKIIAGDWVKQIWSYGGTTISQSYFTISCLEGYFFSKKKADILVLKIMMKNLYWCFCTKTRYSFNLNYKCVGQRVCGGWRKSK